MLVDVITVTVLAFFGSRLAVAARQSMAGGARQRTAEIGRGLRPRHFLRAPLVLAAIGVVATLLLRVSLIMGIPIAVALALSRWLVFHLGLSPRLPPGRAGSGSAGEHP